MTNGKGTGADRKAKAWAAIDPNSLKQKNTGKVQFNAVREEVRALLDKGYSRRVLHAVLREKGLFTGSYRRFCEYVQGTRNRERGKEKLEPALVPPNKTAAPGSPAEHSAQPEKPAAGGFAHTNTPNVNDLI